MLRRLLWGVPLACIAAFSCTMQDGSVSSDELPMAAKDRVSFSAMTFNVKWNDGISNTYAERAGCMAEHVTAERADILAVQEIRSDMAPVAFNASAGREKLAPMMDALALRSANDPGIGTHHNFSGKAKLGAIDYLFHSNALVAEQAVVHDAPSPRCPLAVENCADHRALGRLCEEPTLFVTNGFHSDHFAVSARFKLR